MSEQAPLLRVCSLLNNHGAKYLIVGARACWLHGYIRATIAVAEPAGIAGAGEFSSYLIAGKLSSLPTIHESSRRTTGAESIARRLIGARRATAVHHCHLRRDRRSHPAQTHSCTLQPRR